MNKLILPCFTLLICCNSVKEIRMSSIGLRPVVIYKTKFDYSNNIPIILNSTKDSVVSYPSISDVFLNGILAIPTQLNNGYLLDNRGINENVAFTSYKYQEYIMLEKTPDANELFQKIIDKNPLLEIHICKCERSIDSYNKAIKKKFSNCKTLISPQ